VAGRYLFRADFSNGTVVQRYAIATNTWTTVASAPSALRSSFGTDDVSVYAYHADNTLRAYNIAGNSWSTISTTGPAAPTVYTSGYLRYTPNGIYYCPLNQSTMHRYQGGAWTSFVLPANCSVAGTFDHSSDRLYIRMYVSPSFMVVNSVTGTHVATVTVTEGHSDWVAGGAYYAGRWYTQESSSAIRWVDATTGGTRTTTTLNAGLVWSAMATDFAGGVIYLSGYGDAFSSNGLVRYDPVAGTLTNLASSPSGISEANLVLVR
jgi:hypothetical protein